MATEQQILLRRGNASDWVTVNPILGDGEPAWERDTKKMKIGDGVTAWNDLPYFSSSSGGGGAEFFNWEYQFENLELQFVLTGIDIPV